MWAYKGADVSPHQSLQRYSELYHEVCQPFAEAIDGYSRNLANLMGWVKEPAAEIVITQAGMHFAAHMKNTLAATEMVKCCFPVDDEAVIMMQLRKLTASRQQGLFDVTGSFHNQARQHAFTAGAERGPGPALPWPPAKAPTKPKPAVAPKPGTRKPVKDYPACADRSRRCFNFEFKEGGCSRPSSGPGACSFKHEKLANIADPTDRATKLAKWAAACAAHKAGR